jgi:hypothetical protein
MNTMLKSEVISYVKPYTGETGSYDPSKEGHFIVCFKAGTTREHTYVPPLPSNRMAQLSYGWVGCPMRSLDLAQREMCAFIAQFPDLAHLVEICKCPFAMAQRDTFRFVTNEPDTRILAMAQELMAKNLSYGGRTWGDIFYFTRDAFMRGEGQYK